MSDHQDHECYDADQVSEAIERQLTAKLQRQPSGDLIATAFETARRTGWLSDCDQHADRYVLRDGRQSLTFKRRLASELQA